MNSRESLSWELYKVQVDMYKFWTESTVRINTFYYAVTGAIVSFYFSRPQEPQMKWALAFPALMSIAICCVFLYGASLVELNRRGMRGLEKELGLALGIEFRTLTATFALAAAMSGLTAIALIAIIVRR